MPRSIASLCDETFALRVMLSARGEHALAASKVHAHRLIMTTRIAIVIYWTLITLNCHNLFLELGLFLDQCLFGISFSLNHSLLSFKFLLKPCS